MSALPAHKQKNTFSRANRGGKRAVKSSLNNLKDRALLLFNFDLQNLKVKLDCEVTTRTMFHYHPYVQTHKNTRTGNSVLPNVAAFLFFFLIHLQKTTAS